MSPLSRSQSRLLHQESMSLQNRLVPFQYSPKSLRQRKLLVPTAPKGNNHGAHGIRVGIKLRQVRFYYSDLPATTLPLANERSYKTTLQDLRAHIVRSAVGDNSTFFSTHCYVPASGQAVVTGVVPFPPRLLPSTFIAQRVQQPHCSSMFHRVSLTHALALSASQFVLKKKSLRNYTSMHSAGLKLTKLTYTRLEDNLKCHRGDRPTGGKQ